MPLKSVNKWIFFFFLFFFLIYLFSLSLGPHYLPLLYFPPSVPRFLHNTFMQPFDVFLSVSRRGWLFIKTICKNRFQILWFFRWCSWFCFSFITIFFFHRLFFEGQNTSLPPLSLFCFFLSFSVFSFSFLFSFFFFFFFQAFHLL